MSDNLSYNLAHAGYNVAKYVPYGPVEAVMPYLLRRANENTAIAGQSSREFNLIKKEMSAGKKEKKTDFLYKSTIPKKPLQENKLTCNGFIFSLFLVIP
jgi:hypothetical protein